MSEQNCYGDGTVFEGVRSKDSVVSTLELPVRSFVRLSEEEAEAGFYSTFLGCTIFDHFMAGVRFAEKYHGIGEDNA